MRDQARPDPGPSPARSPAVPEPSPVALKLDRAGLVWAAVAGVLVLVGWYKSINLLLLVGYVLLVLLGLNAWHARRAAGRLAGSRRPAGPVYPGEVAAVTAEVGNPSARPVTALVTDAAGSNRAAWLLAPVGPGEVREVVARWAFGARGRYPTGPLMADVSYPLGLAHAVRVLAPPGEVVVLPAVGRVDPEGFRRWLARQGAGAGQARRPARRPGPGDGDVRGVRPYRPGDGARDIHWKSSARRGHLLVREYDRAEPLDLVVVVDPWAPAGDPSADARARLEWALSLAMTLGRAWGDADTGAELTLVVPGDPPVVRAGRATPGFVRQAFADLAGLTGTPAVPPVPAGAARRRSGRAAPVVVSTRPRSPVADGLRRAGVPAAVADPGTALGWYTPPKMTNAPPVPRQ